ncbi:hypothetical protein EDE08_10424 [Bradyrhizobium sp. R2.2-H]|jgi:hypothetical protein|uniref:hypothetical protein n=1 Tax=unclassified Bradyrhizobium TaxID=2631580 RepID=UPI001050AA36|nr:MULTISPECIES: hypothetical protein [unclassified Bradyrhizobium]TCU73948.1 hypothetical protein EDE10_104618 [Bradyrhizobium sp. Y-H1]TCU75862.1 hypothetical protein EDE08_10424 [Bradyrhizobium sp. R2.2-H]
MYANPQRVEYEALVGRLRKHYGNSLEVGGYDHNSLLRLRQLDAKREAEEARSKAAQPLNDATAQLNREHQRAVKAWQQIEAGQERIAEHKRAHQILGFDLGLLEPMPLPEIVKASSETVEAYDAATAEMSQIATALESKARKINSAASQWAQYTPDQQNRALILALADRLGV